MGKYLLIGMLMIAMHSYAQKSHIVGKYSPMDLTISLPDEINDTVYRYTVSFRDGGKKRKVDIPCEVRIISDTCTVSPVRIDDKDLTELMLSAPYSVVNGANSAEITEVRIWSLDLGKELFVADTSSYWSRNEIKRSDTSVSGIDSFPSFDVHVSSYCQWSYHLGFVNGKMIISHLKVWNEYQEEDAKRRVGRQGTYTDCKPDHEEGIYILRNGKFVKQ